MKNKIEKKLIAILVVLIAFLNGAIQIQAQQSMPPREWATYYGGSAEDDANSVAVDSRDGSIYMTGYTYSSDGIATSGTHQVSLRRIDAYLVKFNSQGVRLWGTYYGGSMYEKSYSVAIDPRDGAVYIAGDTISPDGIATIGAHQQSFNSAGVDDAFLAKFNSSGVLLWGTYYGGDNYDDIYSTAVNPLDGMVYVVGRTLSSSSIAFGSGVHQISISGNPQFGDAFLVKFDSNGARLWGTYFGGELGETGKSVAIDPIDGSIYMAGTTQSHSLIAYRGHQMYMRGCNDAFLAKFDTSGARIWSTYYGGGPTQSNTCGNESGNSVAVNPIDGAVYMAGMTDSENQDTSVNQDPFVWGGHQNSFGGVFDAFLIKFRSNGRGLWATYYGGIGEDQGLSVAVDPSNEFVYLAGNTTSPNSIASPGLVHQSSLGGTHDAFLVKFDSRGVRQWGTYYGGSVGPTSYSQTAFEKGGFVAVDPRNGAVYLAGKTASVDGIAFQGHQNSLSVSSTNFVSIDAFLVKFSGETIPNPCRFKVAWRISRVYRMGDQTYGDILLRIFSGGVAPYRVQVGNQVYTINSNETIIPHLSGGTHRVIVTDSRNCQSEITLDLDFCSGYAAQSDNLRVRVGPNNQTIGTAEFTMSWGTGPYEFTVNGQPLNARQVESNRFIVDGLPQGSSTVTIKDFNGCITSQTVFVRDICADYIQENTRVNNLLVFTGTNNQTSGRFNLLVTGGQAPYEFTINNQPLNVTMVSTYDYIVDGLPPGTHTITIKEKGGCTKTVTVTIPDCAGYKAEIVNVELGNNQTTGRVTLKLYNGLNYYVFWMNDQPLRPIMDMQGNYIVDGIPLGTHTIKISDSRGCTTTVTFTLRECTGFTANLVTLENSVNNNQTVGRAKIKVEGGTSPYQFMAYNQLFNASQDASGHYILDGLRSGNNIITIRDSSGCTTTLQVVVPSLCSRLRSNIIVESLEYFGDDPQLRDRRVGKILLDVYGGTPSYDVTITGGSLNATITGNGSRFILDQTTLNQFILDGTYVITVKDSNGCVVNHHAVIDKCESIICNIEIHHATSNIDTGKAKVTVTGASPPFIVTVRDRNNNYIQQFINYSNDFIINNLRINNYIISVADSRGCVIERSFIIKDCSGLDAELNIIEAIVDPSQQTFGTIEAKLNDNNPYVLNIRSLGRTVQGAGPILNMNQIPPGIYEVVISNSDKCWITKQVEIPDCRDFQVVANLEYRQEAGNRIARLDLNVSGGLPEYTIKLNNQNNTDVREHIGTYVNYSHSFENLNLDDVYTITVKDKKNCTQKVRIVTQRE